MLSHIQNEIQSRPFSTGGTHSRLRRVWLGLRKAIAAHGHAQGDGERRLRLRTLILIRWIAIVGQAFTIALVHFSLEFRLPLWPLFGAVALSALINLGLSFGFAATTRLTERSAALLLGYDILQLAFLLALTGGLQNPFSILLIVPVTLSATTLSLRTTVVLSSIVIAVASWLALFPGDLPWHEGTFRLPALYVGGLWLALVLGTALIAGYAWRIAYEARRLSEALAATQMALAREQQLSALGGLAAAAAHDLGSPLATIAVTARELANSVPEDSPLAEDVAELVTQTRRCREILKSLSQQPESEALRPFTRVPLSALLRTIANSYGRPEIALDVAVARMDCGCFGTTADPDARTQAWLRQPDRQRHQVRPPPRLHRGVPRRRSRGGPHRRRRSRVFARSAGAARRALYLDDAAQRWTWSWRVHRPNTACANRRDAAV